jgi:hypothetical protein
MGKAEQYRLHAAEGLRIAQEMQDHREKASLQMAETWRRLAERAEARAEDEAS